MYTPGELVKIFATPHEDPDESVEMQQILDGDGDIVCHVLPQEAAGLLSHLNA